MLALVVVGMMAVTPASSFRSRVEALRASLNEGRANEVERVASALLEELTAASRAKDRTPETLVLLGRVQLYLDQQAAAALTLDQALALAPDDYDAHFYRGIVAEGANALELATEHLGRCTELDARQARGWSELGGVLLARGLGERAVVALEKAIALDPKDAVSLELAGNALVALGRGDQGIALLEEAFALAPNNPSLAFNTGLFYQLHGKPKLALARFGVAAQLDAADWHARAKLVQVHQQLGQRAERDRRRAEVLALWRAKKIDPRFEEFCREQFEVGGDRVKVFESFELKGARAVRYSFRVLPLLPSNEVKRELSLGSYDFTTQALRGANQLGAGQRAWHLDGSGPGALPETFGIWPREPSYEVTRAMVVDVLEGRLEAASSTRVTGARPPAPAAEVP